MGHKKGYERDWEAMGGKDELSCEELPTEGTSRQRKIKGSEI